MRLNLGNNFYCDVDQLNWTLKRIEWVEEYTDKRGRLIEAHERETIIGYYGNFEQVVNKLLKYFQNELSEELQLDLKEYVDFIGNANKMALDGFKAVKKGIQD